MHSSLAVAQPRSILLHSSVTLSSLLFFQTPSDLEEYFAWDVQIFWETTPRNIHIVVMPDDHSHRACLSRAENDGNGSEDKYGRDKST
jgi:hypothetical protein